MSDTPLMSTDLPGLVTAGTLDARLGALVWLLLEDGVPLVVTGSAPPDVRRAVALALVSVPPVWPVCVVDADQQRVDVATLAEPLTTGARLVVLVEADDLRAAWTRLTGSEHDLPEDALRRLGVVLVVGSVPDVARPGPIREVPRIVAAHYLRPAERDPQGHVQRRPPAVLSTWRAEADVFDDYAWGVTPELADRVDRSQADLEEAIDRRAAALEPLAGRARGEGSQAALEAVLAAEPSRTRAAERAMAVPSPVRSMLTDPQAHDHGHDQGEPHIH